MEGASRKAVYKGERNNYTLSQCRAPRLMKLVIS